MQIWNRWANFDKIYGNNGQPWKLNVYKKISATELDIFVRKYRDIEGALLLKNCEVTGDMPFIDLNIFEISVCLSNI